jgi:S1-C subfamily serine protease
MGLVRAVVEAQAHRLRPKGLPLSEVFGRIVTVLLGLLAACPGTISAQPTSIATADIFRQFSEHVLKIEVVETGSAAKATIGTGFIANSRGDIVTNYHVVSKLIHAPERYRIEVTDAAGQVGPADVAAVDVIYDLAVLRANRPLKGFLKLQPEQVYQGARLYSLGHPKDLGLTIVEGTYNGLLKHTLYPKVHFTGSLNPGMSGGPTVSQSGNVVGVNVASAEGQQISFLVPVERVLALLARTQSAAARPPASFLAEVGRQIHDYQATYLAGLFAKGVSKVNLGPYELPTKPAPFFRCWADAVRRKDLPYAGVNHDCSTDDYIFVSSQQSSGIVRFFHQLLTTEELNPLRFFSLYSDQYQSGKAGPPGNEEEVTSFRCETRNVKTETGKLRAVLCARQYVKLQGLYDAVFKAGTLGARNVGLVSTLSLSGVSFENVEAVTRRYLESIQWRR